MRGFLVERGTPGFSTRDIEGKFSLRASVTSELVFEDCAVPLDAMLPGVKGLKGPLSCLNQARYGIAWGAVGAAMACYDEALRYTKERVQFKRPIAGYQLVQEKLVNMVEEITKAQLLAWRLGKLKEAGKVRAAAGVARQAQQREDGAQRARATRAICSAPTASPTSTRPAATCATSSRCSPTRARTTSTR